MLQLAMPWQSATESAISRLGITILQIWQTCSVVEVVMSWSIRTFVLTGPKGANLTIALDSASQWTVQAMQFICVAASSSSFDVTVYQATSQEKGMFHVSSAYLL